jgi:predicted component of type VI protein secretion system
MVLDYRTVSARHAAIRFKNGEFIFTDAGSSNGSYLYLRRPLELSPSQSVQFRLGRSMISMKVVNKWNRRLLRAVRRTGQSGNKETDGSDVDADDRSIGSNDDDIRITDSSTGVVTKTVSRRTRESVLQTMPAPGQLSQQSSKHLDLLYALAYPKRDLKEGSQSRSSSKPRVKVVDEVEEVEGKAEEEIVESNSEGVLATA